jgi:uncharacterized membrane protein
VSKGRVEAFSDGVLAIILTIMAFELKVPTGGDLTALGPLVPLFLTYALSFLTVAIFWSNHHHLFQAAVRVDSAVLWANLNLLFWLSLVPFVTGWMGANSTAPVPVAAYGVVKLLAAFSYRNLQHILVGQAAPASVLAQAIRSDRKGLVTLAIVSCGIPCAIFAPWLSQALYVTSAAIWLVPDSRIERALSAPSSRAA